MKLVEVAELARPPGPAEAEQAPWLELEHDDDVVGLLAWFVLHGDQDGVRLAIAGEDAGYLARTDLYAALSGGTLGFGDALRWTLPGTPGSWQPYELRCPVEGCRPHYVVRFDPARPPTCPEHGQPLSLAR
jgi:hypothetical protein